MLQAEGQGHLPDALASELEQAWGLTLKDGRDPKLDFMAHLWQPIRCHYRPLAFYVGIELLFAMKHVIMLAIGFTAHKHQGFNYYTKGVIKAGCAQEHSDANNQVGVPILFMHGVGLGALPYISFVMRLAATHHPVIVLESNHLGRLGVHMGWVCLEVRIGTITVGIDACK